MLARRSDHHDGVSPAVIRSLRDRIDLLEEENRQLREAAEALVPFPADWKITKVEARFLSALMRARSGCMSSERLLTAIYGLEPDVQPKIIDVWACKLRKKLASAGAGIKIRTLWGEGYGLSDADRDRLRAILAGEPNAEARREREIQAAVAEAAADLKARIGALQAENERLGALATQAAPARHAVAARPEPVWRRYATGKKPRKAAAPNRTSGCRGR